MHHPHRSFHSCRNEMASKGREGGSIRDASPVCITQLTHHSGVGACLAAECKAAWSRHSWDHRAQRQPGHRQHVQHQPLASSHSSDYNKLSQLSPLHSRHVPVPVWLGQVSPNSKCCQKVAKNGYDLCKTL